MKHYVKIGRDIIVGKGWGAKHWSGPVVFGQDAIYICPNASQAALIQGWDSGAAAAGLLGAIGGALAGAVRKQDKAQPSWQGQVVDLRDLPSVFSRKGLDSSIGGIPSPIFPGGAFCSLPALATSDNSNTKFDDLTFDSHSIGKVVRDLSKGKIMLVVVKSREDDVPGERILGLLDGLSEHHRPEAREDLEQLHRRH